MTNQNQAATAEKTIYDVDDNGYVTVRTWVCVDADGAYEAGTDEDEARDRFNENISGDETRRTVCIEVRLRVPRPVTVGVQVPDEAGSTDVEAKASE